MQHPVRRFLLHLLAVIIAMAAGMMTLFPLWLRAIRGAAADSWLVQIETSSLVMATTMALPVVVWMRIRRYRWRPTLELVVAVYAGFVLLFPFFWAGILAAGPVMLVGHVLMAVFVLVAMLFRRDEYAGGQGATPAPAPAER